MSHWLPLSISHSLTWPAQISHHIAWGCGYQSFRQMACSNHTLLSMCSVHVISNHLMPHVFRATSSHVYNHLSGQKENGYVLFQSLTVWWIFLWISYNMYTSVCCFYCGSCEIIWSYLLQLYVCIASVSTAMHCMSVSPVCLQLCISIMSYIFFFFSCLKHLTNHNILKWPWRSVNFISLVTSCVGLWGEEPQTARPMSFTWASQIAVSVLTGL